MLEVSNAGSSSRFAGWHGSGVQRKGRRGRPGVCCGSKTSHSGMGAAVAGGGPSVAVLLPGSSFLGPSSPKACGWAGGGWGWRSQDLVEALTFVVLRRRTALLNGRLPEGPYKEETTW